MVVLKQLCLSAHLVGVLEKKIYYVVLPLQRDLFEATTSNPITCELIAEPNQPFWF